MFRRWHFAGPTILTTLGAAACLAVSAAAYGQTAGALTERQAVLSAQNTVATAQIEAGRSSVQLRAVTAAKRQEFTAAPDMVAALAAYQSTHSAYDGAKARVRRALDAKPEYLAAVAARDQTQRASNELRKCGAAPEARFASALAALAAATAVDKLEDQAFDADAPTREARSAAAAAATTLAGLRQKFAEDLKTDTDVAAAKASLAAASTALRAAQAQLSAAIRAESIALAAARPAGTLSGPYIFTGGQTAYLSGANFTPGAIGGNLTVSVIPYGTQLVITSAATTR